MASSRRDFLIQSAISTSLITLSGACSRDTAPQIKAPISIDQMDGVATATAIRNRDITALEAIDAAITRTQKVNPKINAIVTETFEAAREQANNLSTDEGALAGVPTFIKDLFDVTGLPTRHGSRSTQGHIAKSQFPFIDDFQAAGLISLGKTTTPEYGLTATTEPVSSGITRNPWSLNHSSGGSSGGAAALVAAGATPFAHATDGGGSIRIPAACCGLVGLKPSRGRFRPARDESKTPIRISAHGVVSRTMRDTAAFMAAMEAPEDESGLAPTRLVSEASGRRLKIGIIAKSPLGSELHEDVTAAISNTSRLCDELGHETREIDPNFDAAFGDDFLLYWAAAANSYVARWEAVNRRRADDSVFEPFTLGLQQHFLANQEKLRTAILSLLRFSGTWSEMFNGLDLVLSPVLTRPPVEIGYLGSTIPYDEAMERLKNYAQFTAPANVAGTPSMSLPMAMSKEGLPVGVMFNARAGNEKTLLELGYELEAAQPWTSRKPAVFSG